MAAPTPRRSRSRSGQCPRSSRTIHRRPHRCCCPRMTCARPVTRPPLAPTADTSASALAPDGGRNAAARSWGRRRAPARRAGALPDHPAQSIGLLRREAVGLCRSLQLLEAQVVDPLGWRRTSAATSQRAASSTVRRRTGSTRVALKGGRLPLTTGLVRPLAVAKPCNSNRPHCWLGGSSAAGPVLHTRPKGGNTVRRAWARALPTAAPSKPQLLRPDAFYDAGAAHLRECRGAAAHRRTCASCRRVAQTCGGACGQARDVRSVRRCCPASR
jgi:hypothetical protein